MLSETVAKALELTGGSDVMQTARFADMFDEFFDTLNVSNYVSGRQERKQPYRSADEISPQGRALTNPIVLYILLCVHAVAGESVSSIPARVGVQHQVYRRTEGGREMQDALKQRNTTGVSVSQVSYNSNKIRSINLHNNIFH